MDLNTNKPLIVIVGAGSFGTALGNALCKNDNISVILLSIEKNVVTSINNNHRNMGYFPNIQLNKNLVATLDNNILKNADVVILVLPSAIAIQYFNTLKPYISPNTILINCAKGFGEGEQIISDYLSKSFTNPVAAMKGPSFAIEVINNMPTGLTFACKDINVYQQFAIYTDNTNIKLDFTTDVIGTELLSIMKNVYAIILGIVDAHLDSINVRFYVFTKVLNEMRKALVLFGGNSDTIFNLCGIGDFGLTSLNDLSRNRTMGLFIGKGFIKDLMSNKVTLEGQHSLNIFYEKIKNFNENQHPAENFPILFELYKLMNNYDYDRRIFIYNILK